MVGGARGGAARLVVFVLACPGVLVDFATGSDFATNAVYVALAVFFVSSLRRDETLPVRALAYLFFALAVSSRPIYVVELPIVASVIWRWQGARRCGELLVAVAVLVAAINLPVFLDDPARFPLLLHANLLRFYPAWLHADVAIPVASLAIACAGFFVDLRRGRIYLLSALALAPMLGPTLAHAILVGGVSGRLSILSGYTLPISLFAGLWLFRPASVGQNSSFPAPATPLLQGAAD